MKKALVVIGAGSAGVRLLTDDAMTTVTIMATTICGLFAAVAATTCFGFGVAGSVIAANAGAEGSMAFLVFAGFALLLALIFLIVGALVVVSCGSKAKAFVYALFTWFFFAP